MHHILRIVASLSVLWGATACAESGKADMTAAPSNTKQISIDRIELMPNLPEPFKIIDFKAIAAGYDKLAFDDTAKGEHLPLLWWDTSKTNFDEIGFGLPAYVGRRKPDMLHHEAVTCFASVLGGTLAGIDKTKQSHNWVHLCLGHFATQHGEDILLNLPAGKSGGSFWYDAFTHVLFYGLVDRYPDEPGLADVMRKTADRWQEACVALGGKNVSFDHTGFRFADMQPYDNCKRTEPEGAAGCAWMEYMAWRKFHQNKHLEAADWCVQYLEKYNGNPYYEILLPYAVTLAARMNAEEQRTYDVTKLMNWCFGPATARPDWGVIVGKWGAYDVSGLSGSITDGGGYAFAMNTYVSVGAMLPTARYDDRYAAALGKWALNAINATRYFYPREMPRNLQSCPDWKGDPQGVICYEGLRKEGLTYGNHIVRREDPEHRAKLTPDAAKKWDGITPYASGDPVPFGWEYFTDFALYGAGHVGMFAAIVGHTDDPRILRLDLLATDFFHDRAYPTSLVYNPYPDAKRVKIDVGKAAVDIYDTVEKRVLVKNAIGDTTIDLPPTSARVLVLAPAGREMVKQGNRLLCDGVVVDYRTAD